MIRLLILDDHTMFAEGLTAILKQCPDYEIIATYDKASHLLAALAKGVQADILMLDISLQDGNGLDVCRLVSERYATVATLMLTMHDDPGMLQRALQNGARGYLLKNTSQTELRTAISMIMNGESFVSPVLTDKLNQRKTKSVAAPGPMLTRREQEVLNYIAQGLTTSKIAEKMFVTVKAVEFHRGNLLAKFDAENAVGLVKAAQDGGFIKP